MPRAINTIDTVHYELKSCPGGFVELRRMTYAQYLRRQEMMMNMQVSGSNGKTTGEMKVNGLTVAQFEFRICVANHNLTDDQDQLLDFKQLHTLEILDPKVGQEIGEFIDKMNQLDEEQAPN